MRRSVSLPIVFFSKRFTISNIEKQIIFAPSRKPSQIAGLKLWHVYHYTIVIQSMHTPYNRIYTKSNSCSDTLLSFHFFGLIRQNFSLEFHTHYPEFLGWSIMIKFHHFRNFLIKIFLFNIQSLVTEMFKVINNIAATITDDLFATYHSYNLRSKPKFFVPSVRTVHNGQKSIQY